MSPATLTKDSFPVHYNDVYSLIRFWGLKSAYYANRVFARYQVGSTYKTLTYGEVDRLSTNMACKFKTHTKNIECVAFIYDHSVNYLICMLAILKLRITMLALSPRNSEEAIVHLLTKTNSQLVIASEKYSRIAHAAVDQVQGCNVFVVDQIDLKALLQEPLDPQAKDLLDHSFSLDDVEKIALIIHSSGSTSFPKPIRLSNRYLIQTVQFFHECFNGVEGKEQLYGESEVMYSCLPLFHIFGTFTVFNVMTLGGSTVFPEKLPPPTASLLDALKQNRCTYLAAPPLILEQLSSHLRATNDFTAMQQLKLVIYGGAPLKFETGQFFHEHNINVRNEYGTTEINTFMSSNLDPKSPNWNALRPLRFLKEYCIWEPFEGDVKHLAVKGDCPSLASGLALRDDGNYATNDIWRETQPGSGFYNYLGRKDDTLIMENGEKTNPVPMEETIREIPLVANCVVIGEGRQCTAALIELDTHYALEYSPDEMITQVLEAVKRANKIAPSHSAILPQMVRILPLNKKIPSTDKGTVIRKRAAKQYEALIEKMYSDFLEGPKTAANQQEDISKWSSEQLEAFLIDAAASTLDLSKTEVTKDLSQSLFDIGLNSLLSIQLRNLICQVVDVPQNFLFLHPSIQAMKEAIQGGPQDNKNVVEEEYKKTEEILEAYLKKAQQDFGVAKNAYKKDSGGHVVLLTGATGSLGSFMLQDLMKNPAVKKVYCLVRGKDNLMKRIRDGFEARVLDASLLDNNAKVEALPMRLDEPNLGFSQDLYHRLKKEVTIVQHCAWLLDFNQPVSHYEKECIRGFYNLLLFAYSDTNPMHVHFISSVSASAAWGTSIPEMPLPRDPHVAMPMGYGHSKYISEHLLNYLSKEKNFPCYVERLGQVCGDSVHGAWNTSEQYPLMFIGGGQVMHKMPKLETSIDWITVDSAASSIVDIMLLTADQPAIVAESIFHIVNPHSIMWSDLLDAMKSCGMRFDTVSPAEWVHELSKDNTNPAYKLMSFYEGNFKGAFTMPIWETDKSQKASSHLQNAPLLNASLFTKYLGFWQKAGFYQPQL
ncbi:hypothetical protein DFQ28_004462 [Apophysomyces sp. BC1034]|nr:putative NRPS-like protein biosynthetic cluster [Apophysomyces sp. BC1015]KAG0182885.1 hypothetical protein DFQ29_001584 [Apophysomyces sp. BC1021]KAG0193570.1 hypothetical protein DFQ28_004462 [Apophysomyces sp. BC1034]